MIEPSQWETALLCNDVSHWLGASLGSALRHVSVTSIWLSYLACTNKETPIDKAQWSKHLRRADFLLLHIWCWFILPPKSQAHIQQNRTSLTRAISFKFTQNHLVLKFVINVDVASQRSLVTGYRCGFYGDKTVMPGTSSISLVVQVKTVWYRGFLVAHNNNEMA